MAYTTVDAVQSLLGPNYGPNPDGSTPDLMQFITMAHSTVLRTITLAANFFPPVVLTNDELAQIETALAAHYYTKLDPLYTSKSTSGASGSFIAPGQANEAERYKDLAINLDYSGALKSILNRQVARAIYLGQPNGGNPPGW